MNHSVLRPFTYGSHPVIKTECSSQIIYVLEACRVAAGLRSAFVCRLAQSSASTFRQHGSCWRVMQEEREMLREQLHAVPAEADPTDIAINVAKVT